MPSSAPMVTTPVPPMPVTRMPGLVERPRSDGARQVGEAIRRRPLAALCLAQACRRRTVTKLGQKPLTQEKSLLQFDWSIARLRPNSVSSGITETQFDFTAVAAAFAHRVVDEHALRRVGERAALAPAALLGGAGLVVDQRGDAVDFAQLALHGVELVAVRGSRRRAGNALPRVYLSGSSVTTTIGLHALGCDLVRDLRHASSVPSTGWPPVIATASL